MKTVFSNALSELVTAAANILKEQRFDSPLAQDWIVVPNQDTGRWLQFKLAAQLGALINTRIIVLNDLTQVIATPFHVTNDKYLYLAIANHWPNNQATDNPLDRVSEINTLVDLFSKYLRDRPDWLVDWQHGGCKGLDQDHRQAELWRKIAADLPSPTHKDIWSVASSTGPLCLPGVSRILLFAPNRLSEINLKILNRLSEAHPLLCLAVNPSNTPWFTDGALEVDETHPLTADLCKEKHVIIRQLMEEEVIDGYSMPSVSTSLDGLKESIFNNSFTLQLKDDSLALVSAQTPTQEVEALKDWLIGYLNKVPDLSLSDVHIVTPDPGLYGPLVQRIFFDNDITQALPTAPNPIANPQLDVVCLNWIHNIFRVGFRATQCIDLLLQPEIQATLRLSDREIRSMCQWVKESGARRGIKGRKHSLTVARKRLIRGLLVDPETTVSSNAVMSQAPESTHAIDQLLQIFGAITDISKLPAKTSLRNLSSHLNRLVSQLTNGQLVSLPFGNLPKELLDESLPTEVLFGFYQFIHGQGISRPLAINNQISVTAPQTIRAISGKVVAILGANDETFPKDQQSHPWNLITRHPRIGDEDEADADRQVFFDIVTNTQDALWISWIGEHPVTFKKELPGFSVISLLNCLIGENNQPIVTEPQPTRRAPYVGHSSAVTICEQPNEKLNWRLTDLLSAVENPAKWFIEQRGAKIYSSKKDDLSFEPASIDALTTYKLQHQAQLGADRNFILELLTLHPELPTTLLIDQIIPKYAPENVIKVNRHPVTFGDFGVLTLGKYQVALDAMRDPTIPWIVIDKENKNHRFLRAMVECLVHFAANSTTKDIKLLTFSNRAYPIRAIPVDEAKDLLSKWLDEFSQISQRPLPLVSPLAIHHAESINAGKQEKCFIHWHDKALVHRLEYRRLLSGLPAVHEEHSRLVRVLVATLLKQRGRGSASL